MLQAAAAVAPRGVYVCGNTGNTATSSGLTVRTFEYIIMVWRLITDPIFVTM